MSISRGAVLACALGAAVVPSLFVSSLSAQAAPAAGRVQGTVKSISGNTIVVTTATGDSTVTLADGARVQQSADLKTVAPSTLDQLAVGDRVLVMGTAGDGGAFAGNRLVMIKSEAIAQRNQASQQDWARRGSGGIVTSVDPSAKTVLISAGAKKITITTTGTTIFRRYAPGSVKFEEAKPGTLADLQAGDQLRVRGDKTADGTGITAEEVVSGSFKNLAGTVVSVNAAANSLVIKDLSSKKNETVTIGSESDLRAMPPEIAARFAPAKSRPGAPAAGAAAGGSAPAAAPAGGDTAAAGGGEGRRPGGYGGGAGGPGRGPGGRGGAADLSQIIPRLPKANLTDIKAGEALMIVASGASASGPFTAITLLTGVEPLLTGPAGSELTIPPWSAGAGAGGEAGGAAE
jgi:hypothetical protein